MKRTVRAMVLAVAVMALTVPAASAAGGGWEGRPFNCSRDTKLSIVMPPSEYVRAIVPFHVVGSSSVLVPFVFTYNGTTYMSKPLAARHAGRLIYCEYVDPEGAHIEITGLLTPAR